MPSVRCRDSHKWRAMLKAWKAASHYPSPETHGQWKRLALEIEAETGQDLSWARCRELATNGT